MIFESRNIRVALEDQIATLWIDCIDNADNRLTATTLDELESALRAMQHLPYLDVLIVRSAKADWFSSGFDLSEFAALDSTAERSAFAARGQQIVQLLEHISGNVITIAQIDGRCRSGGLELALACDYRIACNRFQSRFCFPEIDFGLSPCWGATLRLPRLIGLMKSLDLLLSGRELTAIEAKRIGLVDRLFDQPQFNIQMQAFVDRIQDAPRKLNTPRRLRHRISDRLLLGRWLACRQAERKLADIDADERPAAQAIIQSVRAGFASPAEALAAERLRIGELGESIAFRNAFEHHRRAEQPPRIYPEPLNPVPLPPQRIGIVGDSEFAISLACYIARQGQQVTLQSDGDDSRLASDRIDRFFAIERKTGRLDSKQIELAKKQIRRTSTWNGIEEAGLVIEACEEDLGVKRAIFHELEQRVLPRAILASTSSAVRIEAIQAELQRPGRVAGLHFPRGDWNDRIVELVRSPETDSATLASLDAWLRAWDKTPIIVADRPGRLVQRVQLVYLSEAVTLVAEGLPPVLIDREIRRFGMARGPLETIDQIGFDRLARLVEEIQLARGDRFCRNLLLERMRAFGWNGCENEGFYRQRWGRVKENHLARMVMWRDLDEDVVSHYIFDPQESLNDGVDRLILRTVNEAAACLAEERDADPQLIDLALAWGMDWAPHRGGPLRYADEVGLTAVVEQLTEFAERFGKRFEPCVELQRRAEAGESFHQSSTLVIPERPQIRQRIAG